jgi:hypothetical protein
MEAIACHATGIECGVFHRREFTDGMQAGDFFQ